MGRIKRHGCGQFPSLARWQDGEAWKGCWLSKKTPVSQAKNDYQPKQCIPLDRLHPLGPLNLFYLAVPATNSEFLQSRIARKRVIQRGLSKQHERKKLMTVLVMTPRVQNNNIKTVRSFFVLLLQFQKDKIISKSVNNLSQINLSGNKYELHERGHKSYESP